jgi:hypothetical protein
MFCWLGNLNFYSVYEGLICRIVAEDDATLDGTRRTVPRLQPYFARTWHQAPLLVVPGHWPPLINGGLHPIWPLLGQSLPPPHSYAFTSSFRCQAHARAIPLCFLWFREPGGRPLGGRGKQPVMRSRWQRCPKRGTGTRWHTREGRRGMTWPWWAARLVRYGARHRVVQKVVLLFPLYFIVAYFLQLISCSVCALR